MTRAAPEQGLHIFVADDELRAMGVQEEWLSDIRRMLSRCVRTASGCLEWQGATNIGSNGKGGYGKIHIRRIGKVVSTHRLMMIATGRDPGDGCACHSCDNRPCVEPTHLFAGSHIENARDAVSKGRAVKPPVTDWPSIMKSKLHHWQRLSPDDVRAIRSRIAQGEGRGSIAADFNISANHVSNIKTGHCWAHLT